METTSKVKIPQGTKVLFRERVDGVLTARRAQLHVDCVHDSVVHVVDERKNGKVLCLSEEGRAWVRGWTGKVAIAFTRALRTEAAKEGREKRELEKKRYEESVEHAVERMRFAADAVKRAKLPTKYRAVAFAGLMSHVPYVSMMPFLR